MKSASPASLLRRLLAGFMLVMLAIWAAALAHIAYQARADQQRQTAVVNKAWTRQIILNLRMMEQHPERLRQVGAAIEALRGDMFAELGLTSRARVQVWKHGRLVYDSAPASAIDPDWVSWTERDAATGIAVRRSEKPDVRWIFTPSAAGYLLTPLAYSLPFLLLPAWAIVRVGLRPLRTIVGAIEQRSSADLSPLPLSPYRELAPLVEAINGLMARLQRQIEHQQQFLSDAAHELKTPLSVIQINAHMLDSDAGPAQQRLASAGLREGVARASHTVHQLLAFERMRPEAGGEAAPIDLAALLRERLALGAPLAMRRDIELELDAEQSYTLPLHRASVTALLDNVIGNAIKYSPQAGRVSVRLEARAGGACVTVNDQGPGIAENLRAKVFERFYRVAGQDQEGSGLGLAIAERAATQNGAAIRLETGAGGTGLSVVIDFFEVSEAA